MEHFAMLHKDLDTLAVGSTTGGTIINASTQPMGKDRVEDLIQANKGVWERWWQVKLKNN